MESTLLGLRNSNWLGEISAKINGITEATKQFAISNPVDTQKGFMLTMLNRRLNLSSKSANRENGQSVNWQTSEVASKMPEAQRSPKERNVAGHYLSAEGMIDYGKGTHRAEARSAGPFGEKVQQLLSFRNVPGFENPIPSISVGQVKTNRNNVLRLNHESTIGFQSAFSKPATYGANRVRPTTISDIQNVQTTRRFGDVNSAPSYPGSSILNITLNANGHSSAQDEVTSKTSHLGGAHSMSFTPSVDVRSGRLVQDLSTQASRFTIPRRSQQWFPASLKSTVESLSGAKDSKRSPMRGILAEAGAGNLASHATKMDELIPRHRYGLRHTPAQGLSSNSFLPEAPYTQGRYENLNEIINGADKPGKATQNTNKERVINVNINRPMIENFVVQTGMQSEAVHEFRDKVEKVLLEILDSANAIN